MYQPAPTRGDTAWFVHDRFGMFIHWGLYALPARHEWVMNAEKMTVDEYSKYFEIFNPDLFDPKAWAKAAREAVMKYFVITTKHHEGFCLWDTQQTDFKITNTPFGRDALREVVEAFRAEGLRVGFYYSLLDWHHPDFPIDSYHPQRDVPDAIERNKNCDMTRYAAYMREQLRELLSEYGKIDILWVDFSYPDLNKNGLKGKGHQDWESEKLLALVRELQPHIIINNRLDLPYEIASVQTDVSTPEQVQPDEWVRVKGEHVVWEACQTLSGSWGYHRDETTWKSDEQLIQMLISTVACGGNLLMNVGPTARGIFDSRALDALRVYGEWMSLHSRSIYGCTQSEYAAPFGCKLTQNGNRLYLHIYNWPFKHLRLKGLRSKVQYAQLLNDASEVKIVRHAHINPDNPTEHGDLPASELDEETLTLELPVVKPDVIVPVIELFLN